MTPRLEISFTRTSPTHHRLDLGRTDGSTESRELETRSCLLHDLVHFAVESEVRLPDAFFGRLADGAGYAELSETTLDGESLMTERLVGAIQGGWKHGIDADRFVERFRAHHQQLGEPCPDWLDAALVERIIERLRQVEGRWLATPFGETMTLTFDAFANRDAVS